jgi:TPR repeat protein
MKTLTTVLLCVGVLFLQGCTYVPAVEPTDLSTVHEESATRSEIEAVLGEPVESRGIDQGSISIYIYDRGAEGGFENPLGKDAGSSGKNLLISVSGSIRTLFLAAPIYWAYQPSLYADKVDEQDGYLIVVYSADDTIIKYSDYMAYGNIDPLMDREVARLNLETRAKNGDPDAQWKLATSRDPQWERWLCLAAHGGNAEAQHRLGKYYRHGGGGVKPDAVTAYLWLSLAETNELKETVSVFVKTKTATGWAWRTEETEPIQTQRDIVAGSMTPD